MGGVRQDVLSEVAAKESATVEELPPLYDYVEPDALEAIVRHADETGDARVTVRFEYVGWSVVVTGSGDVRVEG